MTSIDHYISIYALSYCLTTWSKAVNTISFVFPKNLFVSKVCELVLFVCLSLIDDVVYVLFVHG